MTPKNSGLLKFLRKIAKDQTGAAAIEFVLVIPIFITIYIGVAEVANIYSANRKANQVASDISGLIAQETSINTLEMSKIVDFAEESMSPYDTDEIGLSIIGVKNDASGSSTLAWKKSFPGENTAAPAATIPSDIANTQGDFVVVTKLNFQQEPYTHFIFRNTFTHSTAAYARARLTEDLKCLNC